MKHETVWLAICATALLLVATFGHVRVPTFGKSHTEPVPPVVAEPTPEVALEPVALEPVATIPADEVLRELTTTRRTEDPVVALARMTVNEGHWESEAEATAIWDVVRHVRARHCDNTRLPRSPRRVFISQCQMGDRVVAVEEGGVVDGEETYLSAMRRLSWIVTGMGDALRSRHRWTATLVGSDERPRGWVECDVSGKPTGCHGRWRHYQARWLRTLDLARDAMTGRVRSDCPMANNQHGPVIAWGNEGDRWLADQRGLVEVSCGDTANLFFARPRVDRTSEMDFTPRTVTRLTGGTTWERAAKSSGPNTRGTLGRDAPRSARVASTVTCSGRSDVSDRTPKPSCGRSPVRFAVH